MVLQKLSSYIPVIKPNTKSKIMWDMLIIVIISLFFFVIPAQICFDMFYDDELEYFFHKYHFNPHVAELFIFFPEVFLMIDTLSKFITGYYENGVIVEDKLSIVHHYLKNGLLTDLLSYFPILIQGIVKKFFPSFGFFLKIFQFLMFFKLKRVKTAILNFEAIIASNGKHDFFLSFCRMMAVIIFISHVNACIWHSFAYYFPDDECCTWLDSSGLKNRHWTTKYIYSFYWAISIMSTIGFDVKISPQNNLECLGGACILFVSVLMFGYCLNTMKQLLDMMSSKENEYK